MRRLYLVTVVIMSLLAAVLTAQGQRAGVLTAQDRREGDLKPGDLAPDFTLEPRGGGAPVTLSSFRGKSPVALVFGSYT